MALAEIRFEGKAIGKDSSMLVILPDRAGGGARYPVFYLLHGLSDDHTIWLRRTRIEWYVRDLPLIVVMPDAGRSFYCDAVEGPAYERYLIEDVIGLVDRFLPTIAGRDMRVIGGLSMGGYGALKLGLKYPDMFCSVTAHSGCHAVVRKVAERGGYPPLEHAAPELARIFGASPGPENDPFALAEAWAEQRAAARLPRIRIDCGVDDFLLDDNRSLHAHFERLGIEHEYEEFAGQHDWDYWDEHIQEAIAFHCKALGIEPTTPP